jgi:hypothetical protein
MEARHDAGPYSTPARMEASSAERLAPMTFGDGRGVVPDSRPHDSGHTNATIRFREARRYQVRTLF